MEDIGLQFCFLVIPLSVFCIKIMVGLYNEEAFFPVNFVGAFV